MTHAVHRLDGIVTPASAAYSAPELEHQLRSSGANALFTCVPLLENALPAAKAAGIPEDRIFLLPVPGAESKQPFKTIDDLIAEGKDAPELKPLNWVKGQGERQVAYLCYSSGTSGLPVSLNLEFHPLGKGLTRRRKQFKSVIAMSLRMSSKRQFKTSKVAKRLV
jgi:acyl-CoA synthetase (AMP-forming)/AMP-acid ligase II